MHFLTCVSSGVSLATLEEALLDELFFPRVFFPAVSSSSASASASFASPASPSSPSMPARSYTRPPSLGLNRRPSFSTNSACRSGSDGPIASSTSSADIRDGAASVWGFCAETSGVSRVSAVTASAPSSSRRRLAAGVASAVGGDASGASEGAVAVPPSTPPLPPPSSASALDGALKKKDVMDLLFAALPPALPPPPGLGLPRFMPLLARADLRTSLVGSLSSANSLINSNYKSDSLNIHTVHYYWQIFGIFGFSLCLVIVIASRADVGRTSTEHAGRRGDDRPLYTRRVTPMDPEGRDTDGRDPKRARPRVHRRLGAPTNDDE